MVFGVILAGGIGSRMGNVEKPKQYLSVGGKPIILHTLEKFYVNSKFEKLIVLCPSQWINHTKNLVKKNFNDSSKIVVIEGCLLYTSNLELQNQQVRTEVKS